MVEPRRNKIHAPAKTVFTEELLVADADLRWAEISVSPTPAFLGTVRDRLMSAFDEFSLNVDIGNAQLCMAIEEALANAFFHGSLGLDSALKEDGTNRFSELARERCQQDEYRSRRVRITELATPFGVWITIRDEGSGFDVKKALLKSQDPEALLASGRGLAMMRAFTDELMFNDIGNEVTLVFYNNRNRDVVELLQERAKNRPAQSTNRTLT